ncbi:hypothetical protein RDI58_029298 [Solanum bulbocastanum]|uniref:Uncharacterized protein n=1 Tax=Solanum bulbocastanum TaxID=147425 RepID=A0AAN8SQ40_SOLBU
MNEEKEMNSSSTN